MPDNSRRQHHVGLAVSHNAWQYRVGQETLPAHSSSIGRLDRILDAEGNTTNRHRLAKQADILLLFYLLSSDELGATVERLGYRTGPEVLARTVEYYLARSAHGSTLSKVVHASVP